MDHFNVVHRVVHHQHFLDNPVWPPPSKNHILLIFRLVYKWFYNVHRVTYALGIIGYMMIMFTFFGLNLILMIKPDVAMGAGITVIFYGLYYGVLGRDFAELCTERIAQKMGVRKF